MNYAVIRHADGKKSKSKYQGGFKNGKNTSAYNHDYYIHNKEKWNKTETEPNPEDYGSESEFLEAYNRYLKNNKDKRPIAAQEAGVSGISSGLKNYGRRYPVNWRQGEVKKNDKGTYDVTSYLEIPGKKEDGSHYWLDSADGRFRSRTRNIKYEKDDYTANEYKPKSATVKGRESGPKTANESKKNSSPKVSKEYQEEMEYNSKKNDYKPETKNKSIAIKKSTQSAPKTGNDKSSFMSQKEKEAIVNERSQMGKKKKYSIIDRLVGKPEYDNLKRAQENYNERTARRNAYNSRAGYRMQTHTATKKQQQANKNLNTHYRTQEGRAKQILNKAQKDYDKTLHAKIEKGKAWLDSIFKDGRRK